MTARQHDDFRLVPWESWQLWNEVRKAIFSPLSDRVSAALNKIAAWRARSSLPVAVEVTWDLISIQRADPYFSGNSCSERTVTNEMLCLMYAMAIMRLINGVVDQCKRQSSSVADRADAAGLPRMLVDIRHEVAHQELPSLSYLRVASKEALEWLKVHYWEAQNLILDNAHKHLQDKLQAYASSCDALDSKAPSQLQGSCKRFLSLRAKKLVELSGPEETLDECDTNGVHTDELTGGEIEGEEKPHDFLFSNDFVDAEFQKSQLALSRAKKRLRSFCQSQRTEQSSGSDADIEDSVDTANTLSSNFPSANQKIETAGLRTKSSSKGEWSVASSWKPCAIGMLPSKMHPGGVLPFLGNIFTGVAKEGTPCQKAAVQEKMSDETYANVLIEEVIGDAAILEIEMHSLNANPLVEEGGSFESKGRDNGFKRLKRNTEAQQVSKNEEPLGSELRSGVPSEDLKVVPSGPPLLGKRKTSLPAGGLLLLEGIYQSCGANQLAAIRSSIQILK